MKTNLMRAAAAALIAVLAAGAVLPGEVAAKPSGGKAPDSKTLPKWYFKKRVPLHCNVISGSQPKKILIGNSPGYTLTTGTRIYWRAKGSRGNASGVINLNRPLRAGGYIYRNVPSTMTGCRAWIMASINRY